ncbi:unnamed protein product [Cylicocyclus nassatus]|uniref:Phlebovirus glycoprotein G2 fusion domain-containing protein n=1 Tax=Cylicocyclus nassatus TaxID=53992 RepID=A0AA36M472_CYLNA|nr:unnamed protein product [Cylicocyclus nassatus]
MRWREEAKLEVTLEREDKKTSFQRFIISLTPNVPVELPSLRIVMTSLALPPISLLNDRFITDGENFAIWREQEYLHLHCDSWEAAKNLNCTLRDDCRCEAAESRVKCQCSSSDLRRVFQDVETSLPIKTPIWQLENVRGVLAARIPQMAMAEFIVDFKEKINDVILEVHNDVCTVDNSILQGCYNCAQGAKTVITCKAKTQRLAEIYCAQDAFAVPCGPKNPQSTLVFALNAARQETMSRDDELSRLKEENKRLRNAIPTLPPPPVVLQQILDHAVQLNQTLRDVSQLEWDVLRIEGSPQEWSDRLALLQMRENECDRFRLELLYLRTQFRMFFVLPHFLVATNAISFDAWKAMIARERRDALGMELLTDQDIVNLAIDDHLRTVTSISQRLRDIRNHLQQEERTEMVSRQAQILAAVNTLVESKESTSRKMEEFETSLQDIVATLQEVQKTRSQSTSEEETSTHREEIIDAVVSAVMSKVNAKLDEILAFIKRSQPTDEGTENRESPDGENLAMQEKERMERHTTDEPSKAVQENVHQADDAMVEDELQLEDEAPVEEIQNPSKAVQEDVHQADDAMVEDELQLEDEAPVEEIQNPSKAVQEDVHQADDAMVEDELQLEDEALVEGSHNEEPNEEAEHLDEEIPLEEELEYMEEANSDDEAPRELKERREMEEEREERLEHRRQRLRADLDQAIQAERDFERLIDELSHRRTCPPRRFTHGFILRNDEQTIQCVFCKRVGNHYSDSCQIVADAATRRDLLRAELRCVMCLTTECAEDIYCRKYAVKCYHCRGYGHHSAICELPEQSQSIIEQLRSAREGLERNRERRRNIERQLREERQQ